MESGLKVHLGVYKYTLCVIVNFGKSFVYMYYTSEMCTAFGVLKDVNISNQYKRQIRIYRKINTSLQYYTFWNFVYYLQSYLHSYFQLFTTTTWLIFAPNITQSTFRMVLYGIIWSPALR